ncbi:hypothetical protein CHUAL_005312 [Chamberlinius hualienensis]
MEHEMSILIVGIEGIGKHLLAKAIQNKAEECKKTSMKLITVTSSTVPTTNRVMVYDLVVIILDHTKQASLEILKDLRHLIKYFVLGRVCYVFIGDKERCNRDFHFDSLASTVKNYTAPVFYSYRLAPTDWTKLAHYVLQFLLKSTGLDTGYIAFPSSMQTLRSSTPFHLFS